jgi:hypothetical protein
MIMLSGKLCKAMGWDAMAKITMEERRALRREFNEYEKAALERVAALGKQYPDLQERLAQIVYQKGVGRGQSSYTIQDIQDVLALIEAEVENYLKRNSPQSN